jgi:outer membrane protein assembly factor BamB
VWVWTAATLALVVAAALLWRGSDAAATQSTTAAPAEVLDGAPAAELAQVWSVTADVLPEDVVEAGRVIVGSESGITALDPATGEAAWRYTRSNARLCGLSATNGVVVAVFRTADRCDEAVALRAGTGVRAWTRSVNFSPEVVIDGTDRIVLASTPTGIATLDPTGNTLRWRLDPPAGCRIVGSDVGSAGVAVLQECGSGAAISLRLIDGFDGSVHWTTELPEVTAADVRLLGADGLLGLVHGDEVRLLAPADGAVVASLPIDPGAREDVQLRSTGSSVMVRTGDTLTVLDETSGALRWTVPAEGLPAAPGPAKRATGDAALLVPVADGFVHRDLLSGVETARSTASGVPAGGVATGVGPVAVLRAGDRVTGFR